MVWAIIVIVLLVSADQLLKLLVKINLSPADSIPVIDNFFYIVNRHNTGAAWSFLAGKEWGIYALAGVSAVVSAIMLVIIWRSRNIRLKACLTIICSGSLGNLIDRVRDRAVTDFLDFHFGSYIFPTFNLADMLIVCGTILLAILILFDQSILAETTTHKKEKPNEPDPAH
ncbi:MAG TPA: signal peptidase II [Clostridiales bacterium]|nr:signal peptidase II [Clostridiales bacterium]